MTTPHAPWPTPRAPGSGSISRVSTGSASFRTTGLRRATGLFAAKALFEETYPDVKVYVDYEIPYFIVSAGNCLTKEEAIMLKGRVSATFPKAFLKQLKREKSPISNLLDQ